MKNIFPISYIINLFLVGRQIGYLANRVQNLSNFVQQVQAMMPRTLKDFVVELDAVGADGIAPEQRYTMVLSKNTEYRFTVCNAEGSEGKAILTLFDMNKLYGSTYNPATGNSSNRSTFNARKPVHII